jgi:GNAT superfamily N-acetyltransferase/chorismate mutase
MPTDRPDLLLRPAAGGSDDDAVAGVYLAARHSAPMPEPVHSEAEIRSWISGRLQSDPVWVAVHGPHVVGYARFPGAWLDDLYVHPGHQGRGVGTALLEVVKAHRPDGFCLWVFESNTPARAFYERHGLVALERTDGSGNEEKSPDLKMAWAGVHPLAFFRSLIDEVDDQLGDVLARRAALTAAVHRHKAGMGEVSRDPDREDEIAAALARRAPALGEERLRRIVHAIVTESIDAARG